MLIFLTTINSFAVDTIVLNKGQQAPFDGILMNTTKANTIKGQLLERNTLLEEKDSFEKSLKLYADINQLNTQKVNLLSSENDRLSKELGDAKSTSTFERIVWFSLGVLATGAVFWGVKQSLR